MTDKKQIRAYVTELEKTEVGKLCELAQMSESELIRLAIFNPTRFFMYFDMLHK